MDNIDSGETANKKPLVLVVDDHESQRQLFKLLADRIGITVHVVVNGEEALESVETYIFDAILMDVLMPKMDGLQCTKKIRELERLTGSHIPIIGVTACVMPGDREKCFTHGMDDYLSKPFTIEQISNILKKWIVQS